MVGRLAGLKEGAEKFNPAVAIIGVLTRDFGNGVANLVSDTFDLLAGQTFEQFGADGRSSVAVQSEEEFL